MDLSGVKNTQKAAWSSGDFAIIGSASSIVGELLCEAVDLRAGQRVLDVATGSGNTALAAARRWCDVTGIDFVPHLLERATKRAEAEGLRVEFREGDAESIPFPEASFDVVLSTFGCMFAPDQEKAARELVRVCKPWGKIGLTCWTPNSFAGEMFRIIAKYVPPAPFLKPPTLWGTSERLRELFGASVSSLAVTKRSFVQRAPSSEKMLEKFRTYFGPLKCAYETLDRDGRRRITDDLSEICQHLNRSGDYTILVPNDYLEVVGLRSSSMSS